MKRTILIASALFAFPAIATVTYVVTRGPDLAPSPALADSPVAQFVGLWEGTGWGMDRTGQRSTFTATERAHWNLAGTAIIIEGLGTSVNAETGETEVGHNAIGIVEHDAERDVVVIHAKRPGEAFTTHDMDIDVDTGVIHWSPGNPGVRFTITLTDTTWTEIGEFSRDEGETWVQFLEMSLERIEK